MKKNVSLILAAGKLPEGLMKHVGVNSRLLVSLGTSLAIESIIEREAKISDAVYLLTDLGIEEVPIKLRKNRRINWIFCQSESDLTQNVRFALTHLLDCGALEGRLFISYGDTLTENLSHCGESRFFVGNPNSGGSWGIVRQPTTGKIEIQEATYKVSENDSVLTGRYIFESPRTFHQLISNPPYNFFRALEDYFEMEPTKLQQDKSWVDLGRLDTYRVARRETMSGRYFNSFDNSDEFFVSKHSIDKNKIHSEYKWFENLPPNLRQFAPEVRNQLGDGYEIKMIDCLTWSEMFVYSPITEDRWRWFEQKIKEWTRESTAPHTDLPDKFGEYFLEKTGSRLRELETMDGIWTLDKNSRLNGLPIRPVSDFAELAKKLIFEEEGYSAYLHGDLVFSNILACENMDKIYLIDPRGSFGEHSTNGPISHDLAKLAQSGSLGYDFILHEEFEIQEKKSRGSKIDYSIVFPERFNTNRRGFENFFRPSLSIRIMATLLLASAIPLHRENSDRMNAMYLVACESLERLSEISQNEDNTNAS